MHIREINCPGDTQFRYQLVFFVHIYGWLKVAFGICCLGKTCSGIFCLGKTCHWHLLPGGIFRLLQHLAGCHHYCCITYCNCISCNHLIGSMNPVIDFRRQHVTTVQKGNLNIFFRKFYEKG